MTLQPSENTPNADLELLGALHALHHALRLAERKAAAKIFRSAKNRTQAIDCVMEALRVFVDTIDTCGQPGAGGQITPPQGPNCRPGFHEEFGICVPNNV